MKITLLVLYHLVIMMFDITIFTIIYNNYGKYLDNWINNIKNQEIQPKEIIVVLGYNHGVDISKYNNIKFIECKSDVMGVLRNEAIKNINTEWMLYFSVDDILLSNAISEIYDKSNICDVVGLKFKDKRLDGIEIQRDSALFDINEITNWRKYNVPGYIAIKKNINNETIFYDEIEIPNYSYLFKIAFLNLKQEHTNDICAIYDRHENSHGDKAKKNGMVINYSEIISKYAIKYFRDYCDRNNIDFEKEYSILKITANYRDKILKRIIKKSETLIMKKERANLVIKKGKAKEIL